MKCSFLTQEESWLAKKAKVYATSFGIDRFGIRCYY